LNLSQIIIVTAQRIQKCQKIFTTKTRRYIIIYQ